MIKYILAKLKIFKKKNITTFNNNNIVPTEKDHYICIPVIDIDSILKIDKKSYPQAYLEECKYKLKKRKLVNDLKGYFKYSKEKNTTELTAERNSLKHRKELEFIIEDQKQAKIYNQIWNKIKELINSVDGVNFGFSDYFRDHGIIIFDTDETLPLEDIVSIYSITIIIESVYRDYYDRFYPQIHLENCIYKKC